MKLVVAFLSIHGNATRSTIVVVRSANQIKVSIIKPSMSLSFRLVTHPEPPHET